MFTKRARNLGRAMASLAISATFLSVSIAVPAGAQEASAADNDLLENSDSEARDEVIVTGSRIRSNSDAVDLVKTIDVSNPLLWGGVDVLSLVQGSPVMSGFQSEGTITSTVRLTSVGTKSINLRGLGTNRTLHLVNGRTVPPAANGGGAVTSELSSVPDVALRSVDILKQGASSIYGSEAISGVVNNITVNDYEGAKVKVSVKAPEGSGGLETVIGGMVGKTSDRGSILLAGEYGYSEALKYSDRDFYGCPTRPLKDPITGERSDILPDGTPACAGGQYGTVTGFDIATFTQFTVTPDATGSFLGVDGFRLVDPFTGDGIPSYDRDDYENADITSKTERLALFSKGSYDFDALGGVTLGYEVGYSQRVSNTDNQPSAFIFFLSPFTASNPFPGIPTNVVAPNTYYDPTQESEANVYRALLTADGSFSNPEWRWSLAYQSGESVDKNRAQFLSQSRFDQAIETGLTPSGLACLDPSNGCVPIDFRDPNSITDKTSSSSALRDFLVVDNVFETKLGRQEFTAVIDGPLLQLPNGKLGFAGGINVRRDDAIVDVGDNAGDLFQQPNFFVNVDGDQDVVGVFAEIQAPLIRDVPLIHDSELNFSGRFTDYGDFEKTTYKASLRWSLTAEYIVRMSAATSFRAPDIFERDGSVDIPANVGNPFNDPCIQYGLNPNASPVLVANCSSLGLAPDFIGVSPLELAGPNPDLKAESGSSFTVGLLMKPRFLPGELSIDYFNIEIEDGIQRIFSNSALACYTSENFSSPFCDPSFVGPRDAAGNLTYIDTRHKNLSVEKVSGIDLEFNGNIDFSSFDFTYKLEGSYLLSRKQQLLPGVSEESLDGLIAYPKYKMRSQLSLVYKDWTIGYSADFRSAVDHAKADPNYFATNPEGQRLITRIEAYTYHNLQLAYEFDDGFDVSIGITNLFDKKPPVVSDITVGSVPVFTVSGVPFGAGYDTQGRSFTASFNYSF